MVGWEEGILKVEVMNMEEVVRVVAGCKWYQKCCLICGEPFEVLTPGVEICDNCYYQEDDEEWLDIEE